MVNYPAPTTRLSDILLLILDGIHRWSAYKVLGRTENEAVLWQDPPLDYATCKDDMRLESARRNISHGDRLSQTDKRQVARDIVSRDPECHLSEEKLAGSLGVTQQTVNIWIKDIRARQKASRDSTILRLNCLGWTQQKIADKVGIGCARISGSVNNANFCIIDTLIAQGREMPYIAGHLNMDLATAWATKLTGLKDQEKFVHELSFPSIQRVSTAHASIRTLFWGCHSPRCLLIFVGRSCYLNNAIIDYQRQLTIA